jgi:hypothetical protein
MKRRATPGERSGPGRSGSGEARLDEIENILNRDESKQLAHSLTSNSRDRIFSKA